MQKKYYYNDFIKIIVDKFLFFKLILFYFFIKLI